MISFFPRRPRIHLFILALILVWILFISAPAISQPTPQEDTGANRPAEGSNPKMMTLEKLAKTAEWIVVGEITKTEARKEEGVYKVYTYVTIKVEQTLAGGPSAEVVVKIPGGTAGEITEDVPMVPDFAEKERVLLFASSGRTSPGTLELLGANQGKFLIIAHSGREWAIHEVGEEIAEKIKECKQPPDKCKELAGVTILKYPEVLDDIKKSIAKH